MASTIVMEGLCVCAIGGVVAPIVLMSLHSAPRMERLTKNILLADLKKTQKQSL